MMTKFLSWSLIFFLLSSSLYAQDALTSSLQQLQQETDVQQFNALIETILSSKTDLEIIYQKLESTPVSPRFEIQKTKGLLALARAYNDQQATTTQLLRLYNNEQITPTELSLLIKIYIDQGNFKKAKYYLDLHLKDNSQYIEMLETVAYYQIQQQQIASAEKILLANQKKLTPFGYLMLGKIYQHDNNKELDNLLKEMNKHYPYAPELGILRGTLQETPSFNQLILNTLQPKILIQVLAVKNKKLADEAKVKLEKLDFTVSIHENDGYYKVLVSSSLSLSEILLKLEKYGYDGFRVYS